MYADLMDSGPIFCQKYIYKTKVSSEIKVFMCFLYMEVVLTKDNLAKHNWHCSKNVVFCDAKETIHHLFFLCLFSTLIWHTIHVTYNLAPPTSIPNLFGNWLGGIHHIEGSHPCGSLCFSLGNMELPE